MEIPLTIYKNKLYCVIFLIKYYEFFFRKVFNFIQKEPSIFIKNLFQSEYSY